VTCATREASVYNSTVNILSRYHETLEIKEAEIRPTTHAKLRLSLLSFLHFCDARGITKAEQLRTQDILEYIRPWKRFADSTRILETRRLVFFLRRLKREDLVAEMPKPRKTQEGNERRKPRPFTDAEITAFRAIANPREELFFLTSIQTGLAVADLVQLKSENLVSGEPPYIRIRRQKTGKLCVIPISGELYARLTTGLPFWTPRSSRRWQTGVCMWIDRMRVLQQKAGIWIRGACIHRGRDSFVDRQIAAGVPIATIAARLGDRVDTLLSHYADLLSPKNMELNLSSPVVQI
jgi:hypothetical protein